MRSTDGLTFTEQARREQIVAAAVEVIATSGYGQASVAKIADHIGIAKSVVLYHFKTKSDIIEAAVTTVFAQAALVIAPAVTAEPTAAGKLSAYIRANAAFIAGNRTAAIAMLEIVTSYRSDDGLRLDQAAANSVQASPPTGDLALLDPYATFTQGVRSGEFRPLSAVFMKNALRAALDGAVWEIARDPDYDVVGYGEELVTMFELATKATS
jgi:TetR/AcrR family transcriptional regulator, fatty acid metabolism regulator protein